MPLLCRMAPCILNNIWTLTTAARCRYTHALTVYATSRRSTRYRPTPFLRRPFESHDTTSNFGWFKITAADA